VRRGDSTSAPATVSALGGEDSDPLTWSGPV